MSNSWKVVYLSFTVYGKPPRWMKIDPHGEEKGDSCFTVMPKFNSPPSHLFISKLTHYATIVSGGTLFFIGGNVPLPDYIRRPPEVYSDKVFTFHNNWGESPCTLILPRSDPIATVFENYMYVFGGYTCVNGLRTRITNKEHWVERSNHFHSENKNTNKVSFEFLPLASAPPDQVMEIPMYHFVYGSQIYFLTKAEGCYSFDFDSQTWDKHINLSNTLPHVKCDKVVIDHLLFCHYFGVIYAYDLLNNRLVLSQRLNQLNMFFGDTPEPRFRYWYQDMSFLQLIAKDTLLLVVQESFCDTEKDLHFYKFQIHNDDPLSCSNLHLVQIGCGFFTPPGSLIFDVVSV